MYGSRWNWILLGTAIASLVALAVLVSSQHRARLIAGSFQLVDSSHGLANRSFRFLPHAAQGGAPSFASDVSLLEAFDRRYPLQKGDALPALDDPDTCVARLMRGDPMHCYNVDIACAILLAREGTPARLWDFNGSRELGGDGHNVLEVYDGLTRSWKAIDPYYHCYYTLGDSVPLGVIALRQVLLTNPERIRLIRYSDTSGERPDSQILGELAFLIPGAMLHENNDFSWRYAHRYAFLTSLAGSLIDHLPLREARGVRTIMLGSADRLLVLNDRFSPHFPFTRMKCLFWGLLAVFLSSTLGLVVGLRSARQRS